MRRRRGGGGKATAMRQRRREKKLQWEAKLQVSAATLCEGITVDRLKLLDCEVGFVGSPMVSSEELKKAQIVEARAKSIFPNVRCTECGSQSIEDSQADVAILLRKLIRDEIREGKTDKEVYKSLAERFGEDVLYAPHFDLQTAAIWLSPVIVAGVAIGGWAYRRRRQNTNVHVMALNLVRGVPLTPTEKETMLELLTPPPSPRRKWWS
ncbi:hypothetical protein ZIOFF_041064 [Zingiber officinale]|uniref:Cytochrome c-type biogenesis protein n=1 Tax=Zingiber officinale TaxID=94328 RepID=A0A8J5L523_ZINOF|nr:hypothetical protein ZIOFF_041064 [Zingiber officinale]